MSLNLNDAQLLKQKAYINGQWVTAEGAQTYPVFNPATGEQIARVADLAQAETQAAVEAAHQAFEDWRDRPARDRSEMLMKWYQSLLDHQKDLARILTAEQGKPLGEAQAEVTYGARFIEWFSEEAKRIYGDTLCAHAPDRRMVVIKQAVGVSAAITPWNFPIAMITRKVAPALAAGCTVIVKPAEDTPLSALALAELADRIGFPKGVLNVVTGAREHAPEIGEVLTNSKIVRKLSFTGSTPVGKKLMAQCAGNIKKISLELGGNAPFIIFNDADLDQAVKGVIASKFRNTGQTCVCANRIYVQEGIYDDFADKLAAAVSRLSVGNGLEKNVDQGPLINQAALEKVQAHVEDARAGGASVLCGGHPHSVGGTFFTPTVLKDVNQSMRIAHEETFGPVAPLFKFETEQEVIDYANATDFGLAAYFYSRDVGRVWRVSEALECGMVGVNEGVFSTEVAPFGGVKESGLGREGSKYGLDEYLENKYICMGGIDQEPQTRTKSA